eukprot:superscaffoldBa00001114_g9041
MLCSSWEAQRLAGDQQSGDIALQMAQRGQRKRAVQAQLGEPSVIPALTLAVTATATWVAQKVAGTRVLPVSAGLLHTVRVNCTVDVHTWELPNHCHCWRVNT